MSSERRSASSPAQSKSSNSRKERGRPHVASALRAEGQTVLFLAADDRAAGLLGVADPIKATTPEALARFHAEGIRVVMLTGDSRTTAEAVEGFTSAAA